jgi:tRNA pseudouridine38/39 synthase
MAVLFLVGSGLEKPPIVTALLNADPNHPLQPFKSKEQAPPVVDRKPIYQMAAGLPLVLWDCGYSQDSVSWRCDALEERKRDERDVATGSGSLLHHLESTLQRTRIEATLQEHFIMAARKYQNQTALQPESTNPNTLTSSDVLKIPLGGATFRRTHKYAPLLERERNEYVDVVNERWRLSKGVRSLHIGEQIEE